MSGVRMLHFSKTDEISFKSMAFKYFGHNLKSKMFDKQVCSMETINTILIPNSLHNLGQNGFSGQAPNLKF